MEPNFAIMSVPDFVAGFVYGMTGSNHLTEIEACYTGAENIVEKAELAFSQIESGDFIKGFTDIGLVVHQFPTALNTCESMGDDIAAIESWATIFTEPKVLAATLSKNWLLHRRTIKGYLADEKSDWGSGKYFQAGVDTAEALTDAVGPVDSKQMDPMQITHMVQFASGFLSELEGEIDETALSECFSSAHLLEDDAIQVIKDLEEGDMFKVMIGIQKVIGHMQKDLLPCKDLVGDWSHIEQWASIFTDPNALGHSLSYNYLTQTDLIKDYIGSSMVHMSAENFKQAGEEFADIAIILLGPLAVTAPEVADMNLDPHMVNYLLAGFVYGMTTQNHLTEIEACYAGGSEMEKEIVTAIGDFKKGGWDNITQGVLEILLAGLQAPQEFNTCSNMQDDIQAIADWASIFTNKTKLVSTVTRKFLLHKAQITADIQTLEADYAAEEYFKAGEEAATLATDLLGPITP